MVLRNVLFRRVMPQHDLSAPLTGGVLSSVVALNRQIRVTELLLVLYVASHMCQDSIEMSKNTGRTLASIHRQANKPCGLIELRDDRVFLSPLGGKIAHLLEGLETALEEAA